MKNTEREQEILPEYAFNYSKAKPNRFAARQTEAPVVITGHHYPHPDITGQVKINGDILNSIPETDWDLPQ